MKNFTIKRDHDADLNFTGVMLASVSSKHKTGRWTELVLYKTKAGKYIAASIGRTQLPGEHDRYNAVVCDTEAEVIAFFGNGWLAKKLYDEAAIKFVQTVD